jgi:hypothetical protein
MTLTRDLEVQVKLVILVKLIVINYYYSTDIITKMISGTHY